MRASEAIEQIKKLIEKHGDHEIDFNDSVCGPVPVMQVMWGPDMDSEQEHFIID